MMRPSSTLAILLILCWTAGGVDLIYTLDFYPGSGDGYKSIHRANTDTGAFSQIYSRPGQVVERETGVTRYIQDSVPGALTIGPDGKIYFLSGRSIHEYSWSESDRQWVLTGDEDTIFIKRFLPPSDADPHPTIETVYTFPEVIPIHDMDVRQTASGSPRIFYSTGATGAGGTGEIYYISDSETPVLYYSLNPEEVGVATCGGEEVGYWAGNFAFDDSGNRLYLSSGNHIPSAIFVISGAEMDRLSESATVSRVHDSSGTSIMGLDYSAGDLIYFSDYMNNIHRLDLSRDASSSGRDMIVYVSSPGDSIEDLAVISRGLGMSRPSNTMMGSALRAGGQTGMIQSGAVRDLSKYEPIPELKVVGPAGPRT